jgi:hypothetical protein
MHMLADLVKAQGLDPPSNLRMPRLDTVIGAAAVRLTE